MRYKCTNNQLEVSRGIVTHSRDMPDLHHQGADALRKATMLGLQRIATRYGAPFTSGRNELDERLFKAIVGKVECFAADGAADEQLAGCVRRSQGSRNIHPREAETPCAK